MHRTKNCWSIVNAILWGLSHILCKPQILLQNDDIIYVVFYGLKAGFRLTAHSYNIAQNWRHVKGALVRGRAFTLDLSVILCYPGNLSAKNISSCEWIVSICAKEHDALFDLASHKTVEIMLKATSCTAPQNQFRRIGIRKQSFDIVKKWFSRYPNSSSLDLPLISSPPFP